MKKVSDFKTRLEKLLKENTIKQVDLARYTGMTTATISRYLSGDREPVSSNIEKLAQYFNVEIAWIMGYDEDSPLNDVGERDKETPFKMFCRDMELICEQFNIRGQMAILEHAKLLSHDDHYLKKLSDQEKSAG